MVSSILIIFLFFINLTPLSYADVISTILVGTNPYGITYGTAYGNGNVYVVLLSSNTVSVISDTTNSIIATVPVGASPYGVAYGNGNIYVSNYNDNTVSVISTTTNSVIATVPVGTSPTGVAYGNGNIYVSNYDSSSVSVISSTTNSVIATVPVGTNPLGVAYGIGNVYVANYGSSSVSVISSTTNSVSSTISVGPNPSWIAFDPNNGYAYVSFLYGGSVSVINGVIQPSVTPAVTHPPSISITYPSNGAVINTDSLTLSGTVSNSTTIKSIQITLDGVTAGQTSGNTWSFLLTALTSGTHTATATVTDSNGNTASSSVTITVAIPPTVYITSPTNGAFINTNTAMISGTASGSTIQSVKVSIDGGAANQASGTTSWSFLTNPLTYGTHTMTATVTDSNGNTASSSVTITKDAPPVLTIPADMTVSPTSTFGTTVSYTVTASDDSGQVSITCSPPSGSTFSTGTNSVTCTATDSGGNKATGSFKVTVLNPVQAIQQLINTVNGMNLPLTVTTNLDSSLSSALAKLNLSLNQPAQNYLSKFINTVSTDCCNSPPLKPLTNAQANLLTTTAQGIINSIP